jgi:hypothetical protein
MPIQSTVGELNEFLKTQINSIIHLFESGCWLGVTCIHSQQILSPPKIVLVFISNSYAQMRLEINSPIKWRKKNNLREF